MRAMLDGRAPQGPKTSEIAHFWARRAVSKWYATMRYARGGSALGARFLPRSASDGPKQRVANEDSPLEELMKGVMERRTLVAGLAVLIVGMFALTGTASAHVSHHRR